MLLSWADLGTSVAVNVGVTLVVLIAFNWFRRLPWLFEFYAAKRKLSIPFRFRPPRLPHTFLTWVVPMLRLSDEKFAACAGFDALAYTQALRLMAMIASVIALVLCAMVLPANLAGSFVAHRLRVQEATGFDAESCGSPNGDAETNIATEITLNRTAVANVTDRCDDPNSVTTFDKTSIVNIYSQPSRGVLENESRLLWVHLVALYLITFITLKGAAVFSGLPGSYMPSDPSPKGHGVQMVWKHYNAASDWRVLYLAWTRKGDAGHTVLLRDIPGTSHGTVIAKIAGNMGGVLGLFIPAATKQRIKDAIVHGTHRVFGKTRWFRRSSIFRDDKYDVYTQERLPPEQTAERAPLHDAHALSDLDARATGTAAPQWGALRKRAAAKEATRAEADAVGAALSPSGAFKNADRSDNPLAHPHDEGHSGEFSDALESSVNRSASFHTARGNSAPRLGSQELRHDAPNADFARPDANAAKEPAAVRDELHAVASATERAKGDAPPGDVLSMPPPTVTVKGHRNGPDGDGDAASELSDQESVTLSSDELGVPGGLAEPPGDIERRRNLGNFAERPPFTDFEVWRQAEEALQGGVSVPELVRRELQRTLGEDCVEAICVVKDEPVVGALMDEYKQAASRLTDLIDTWLERSAAGKPPKRRTVKVRAEAGTSTAERWGAGTSKQDEMEYLLWVANDLKGKVLEAQAQALRQDTSAAFVTLTSRKMQTILASSELSRNARYWRTAPAPDPCDIIWANVSLRVWERVARQIVGWLIFAGLVLSFVPVVAFVQSLINLEAYAAKEQGAWARWLLGVPVLSSLLKSILPTLAFKIFLILVPVMLRWSERNVAGLPSKSAVDFGVGRKYFVFQLIVVWLFSTVIGIMLIETPKIRGFQSTGVPLVDLGKILGENPRLVRVWLARSIPQQASFFMMYVLTNGLFASALAFLRLPGALVYVLLRALSATAGQRKRQWSQQYMAYGDDVPQHTITFLLLLIFGVAQPLLAVVAALYFGVSYIYARYDLLYVQRETFQSGGLFWPVLSALFSKNFLKKAQKSAQRVVQIADQIYTGLLIALIGYAALFGIKSFAIGAALVVPLIFAVCIVWLLSGAAYGQGMHTLPLHAAADLDRADVNYDWIKDATLAEEHAMVAAGWDTEDVKLGPVRQRYRQPSLVFDDYSHRTMLRRARTAIEEREAAAIKEDVNLLANAGTMPLAEHALTCCLILWGICGFEGGYEQSARRARVPRRYR